MSTMLEFREVHRHEWSADELRAMLRHQFAAPLHLSLGTLSGEVAHQLRRCEPPLDPLLTLGELLRLPRPPVELLELVKRFAKACRSDPYNPLPSEVVMLLYYTSISVAMQRLNQPISHLGPGALRRGLTWLCEQPWVDEEIRSVLSDGLRHLDPKVP
jgi:hypothetical protein